MLDHDTRLSLLKLGEFIYRPDPEALPKLSIKLAAVPGASSNSVPILTVDTFQQAEPPSVQTEPPKQLELHPEQLAPPVIDESTITVDVDDSIALPHVDAQGELLNNVSHSSLTLLVLLRCC